MGVTYLVFEACGRALRCGWETSMSFCVQRKLPSKISEPKKAEGVSNCPYCAIGHDQNVHRIYKIEEMDADHVTAWSKRGATSIEKLPDVV